MKKIYSLLLCSLVAQISSLDAEEFPIDRQQEIVSVYLDEIPPTYNGQLNESSLERSFFYTSCGVSSLALVAECADLGIGYRKTCGYYGYDVNINLFITGKGALPFVQATYLSYPRHDGSGPYFGVGVSFSHIPKWEPIYFTVPLQFGYQTSDEVHPVFTQFQINAGRIPAGTASVGVGF